MQQKPCPVCLAVIEDSGNDLSQSLSSFSCRQEIVFFEEGEPLLDGEPGDLKFHVKTRPHQSFERDRSDLKYNLTISLLDALVGFSTEVS